MEDRDCALDVSDTSPPPIILLAESLNYLLIMVIPDTEEFALMEICYTVCRLIQVFPHIKVPQSEPHVEIGKERQTLTLVVSCYDGCRVAVGS